MSLGRRKVALTDSTRWVFNRMADVYDARPAYPAALLDAVEALARSAREQLRVDRWLLASTQSPAPLPEDDGGGVPQVTDVGAGIGHLALPLAARGLNVVAVEPALSMLHRLEERAHAAGLAIAAQQATAESLPVESGTQDLVVIADAFHFLDAELTGTEVARVLSPRGALALITCELGDTPYMRQVVALMEDAVPRRPRALDRNTVQLGSLTGVPWLPEQAFDDETPMDHATLDRILRSISFIGPAMNETRFAEFRARVHAIPGSPLWARRFTLRGGFRSPSRRAQIRAERARRTNAPTDA